MNTRVLNDRETPPCDAARSEPQLLDDCRRGDAEAWDELIEAHYPAVSRFVAQLGYDLVPQDIEEICQETFVAVIRHFRSFKGRCQFRTWLCRIAINKTRDYLDRLTALKRGGGLEPIPLHHSGDGDFPPVDPACPTLGPDGRAMQADDFALVGRAVSALPPRAREIIALHYFADLSCDEIASALRLNTKAVRSRLGRALKHLEQAYHRMAHQFPPPLAAATAAC